MGRDMAVGPEPFALVPSAPRPGQVLTCPRSGYETWQVVLPLDIDIASLLKLQEAGASFRGLDAQVQQERWQEPVQMLHQALASVVWAWNFTDETGQPYPPPRGNPDAFARIPLEVLLWLMEETGRRGMAGELAKKAPPPPKPTSVARGRHRQPTSAIPSS